MLRPSKIQGYRQLKFVDVFCGEYSTFLRADDGRFFAFGLNNSGQLAIALKENLTNEDTLTMEGKVESMVTLLAPTRVEAFNDLQIYKVAAGKDHALGINEAGSLFSWGVPTYGVLGRADMKDHIMETTPHPVPAVVSGLQGKTIVDVTSGQVIFLACC